MYALLLSVATFLSVVNAANILVFVPLPLKSHIGGFQPMFEQLSQRGHNVTVVSAFPLTERRHIANYTDITVPLLKIEGGFDLMQSTRDNFITKIMSRWYIAKFLSETMEFPIIKQFIQSESNSFDLVIVESFLQEYTIALGHKFNAPVINLSPAMIWVSMSKWLHVPSVFSYIPDCCIGTTDQMNFGERLINTITGFIELYMENYLYIPMIKSIMDKHFAYKGWESRLPLENMLRNVSLTLMNSHNVIGVCRPYLPGIIEVGGMHIKDPKPLPQDIQDYINSATDGVIFFSFGSFVNLSHIPKKTLNMFLNVIGKLKQKVILKWEPDDNVKLPQNLKTGSWFPQNDILAHPNVKLFITHGGFHSIEEALYNAKPVVGIPFIADQLSNMKHVEKRGYGKLIHILEITEELFGNAIEEVLSNPTFKNNVNIQSIIYKDQSMKPLDRAIYWIEYVIRNDGAKYLISDSIELNDAQYFLFDITICLLLIIGIITYFIYSQNFIKTKHLLSGMFLIVAYCIFIIGNRQNHIKHSNSFNFTG